jgi:hypothetical protein
MKCNVSMPPDHRSCRTLRNGIPTEPRLRKPLSCGAHHLSQASQCSLTVTSVLNSAMRGKQVGITGEVFVKIN